MSISTPLQYVISSWDELPSCMSNISNRYHIQVSKIMQNNLIQCTAIVLRHEDFGVLFACTVGLRGTLTSGNFELSTQEILSSLANFGYVIEYHPSESLPSDQLEYLMTLRNLRMDRLRSLSVQDKHGSQAHRRIVLFSASQLPDCLVNTYTMKYKDYQDALASGAMYDITNISAQSGWSWSWLTDGTPYNIDDILRSNMNEVTT